MLLSNGAKNWKEYRYRQSEGKIDIFPLFLDIDRACLSVHATSASVERLFGDPENCSLYSTDEKGLGFYFMVISFVALL